MFCVWLNWKAVSYYEFILENQKINPKKYCSQLKAAFNAKHPEFVKGKHIIFHQDKTRPHVSLITRKKLLQPGWEVLISSAIFTRHCTFRQTLHIWMSIYFGLYKILLMERQSIPWKTVKGIWNISLLKKTKSFGKMKLWSCLENDRKYWNKMVNMLFNKVLGKNEKCVFYFYLKIKGNIWLIKYKRMGTLCAKI